MPGIAEIELYAPVKHFLEGLGYEVKGEVRDCDLAAVRGDSLIVVELKRAVNITLILQGVERQKLTDEVYLAVEEPGRKAWRRWLKVQGLCRRLGLGLISVRFGPRGTRVEVVCDPGPFQPRRTYARRRGLLEEFRQRTGDYNTGGGSKRPVVTAYREEALLLARELGRLGQARVKDLRAAAGCAKAQSILYANYYGWFERVERGIYRLNEMGARALETYADVVGGMAAGGAAAARDAGGDAVIEPGSMRPDRQRPS